MSMAELSSDMPPSGWPPPGLKQECWEGGVVTWGQEGPPPGMVVEPDLSRERIRIFGRELRIGHPFPFRETGIEESQDRQWSSPGLPFPAGKLRLGKVGRLVFSRPRTHSPRAPSPSWESSAALSSEPSSWGCSSPPAIHRCVLLRGRGTRSASGPTWTPADTGSLTRASCPGWRWAWRCRCGWPWAPLCTRLARSPWGSFRRQRPAVLCPQPTPLVSWTLFSLPTPPAGSPGKL